ncbi:hypothetical protein K435DRAFT_853082 [Dendrothele bispora CBS 962.96]|uniref:CxC1-like cysteine cluster associated with KDZ transposases domain-containing protein n=1 Tax=Dendrothele bispora (strain CBS 962.96) TaxID=1314807 RepID=A0A4V6T5L2_DENBC|nr:hypothetical protein K435DRAFT_853082 [Dendrothele bispora CBS 962.96]
MSRFRFGSLNTTTPPRRSGHGYAPTTISTAPGTTRRNASSKRLVILPGDRAMVQSPSLPVLRGQAGLRAEPVPAGNDRQASPVQGDSASLETTFFEHFPLMDMGSPSKTSRSTRQKKELQARNWLEKVIPCLIEPYMELMQKTEDLRRPAPLGIRARCECTLSQQVTVLVLRFDKIEEIQVPYCTNCELVAVQLVRSGLFPCAPFRPSLAVDIRMLDFVARLFLRVSPNHTAWCHTLEDYLGSQGYRIHGTDPLRRRFANALTWFNSLQNAVVAHVKSVLDGFRIGKETGDEERAGRGPDSVGIEEWKQQAGHESESEEYKTPPPPERRAIMNTDTHNGPPEDPGPAPRASEYLRSRCPLCFGSTTPPILNDGCPTVVVCVDACFTHKHNDQNGRDPRWIHPDTMFISPEKVQEMEDYVEARRNSREAKRSRHQDNPEDDCMEPGMKVPKSVLDSCGKSFEAANGTAKSRGKGFDERALAGMFCPHGGCLFLVTMSSVGEKQHYILVMLQTLFNHIPDSWTVGFLYDIACQVERSCWKWGFLAEYMERIVWGVSVFHAYGHEWGCQVVYHPRKCRGFGLCDRETCERCWHAISRLIAYTRVAGYHIRLYTLDTQFHFNNKQNVLNAGTWLRRKLRQCESRRRTAQEELDKTGQPTNILHEQWANQVASQTKPLARQKKQAAKTAVEETLRLRKNVEVYEQRVIDLEAVLLSNHSRPDQRAMAGEDIQKAKSDLVKARQNLAQQERSLGIPERRQLKHLLESPFLTKRMNALSLKMRLRQRLRARKFELNRLERSYRKQRSEQRLDDHTREAIQRHLIRQHQAPSFAIAPKKIERQSLFELDVDEEIWQDVGLDEDAENPPLWLCNEEVRRGIRAVLELDRCDEENSRLRAQRKALQEWFMDEWYTSEAALEQTRASGLQHQLKLHRKSLLTMYAHWEKPLVELSDGFPTEWGPSQEDISEVRHQVYTDAVESEEIGDLDIDFEEEADPVLVERLDTFELVDSFRGVEIDI